MLDDAYFNSLEPYSDRALPSPLTPPAFAKGDVVEVRLARGYHAESVQYEVGTVVQLHAPRAGAGSGRGSGSGSNSGSRDIASGIGGGDRGSSGSTRGIPRSTPRGRTRVLPATRGIRGTSGIEYTVKMELSLRTVRVPWQSLRASAYRGLKVPLPLPCPEALYHGTRENKAALAATRLTVRSAPQMLTTSQELAACTTTFAQRSRFDKHLAIRNKAKDLRARMLAHPVTSASIALDDGSIA